MQRNEILTMASEHWREGRPLEAGKAIFESLPEETRSFWAANIMRFVLKKTQVQSPPIEKLLRIADDPSEWPKAHDAFSLIRKSTLKLEEKKSRSRREDLLLCHLLLAELVAKVTYNSVNPMDGFDEDSGWWIAVCLKEILDLMGSDEFSNEAWSILCFVGVKQ